MRGQHEMPTASVVRSRKRRPPATVDISALRSTPAAFHLSSPDSCSDRWGHLSAAHPLSTSFQGKTLYEILLPLM